MKLWLMLLLCFAIPLQGMASVRASHSPCVMEAGSARGSVTGGSAALEAQDAQTTLAAGSVSSASAAHGEDCCNEAGAATNDGQPCKTGQECSAPAFPLTGALRVLAVARSSAAVVDSPAALAPPGRPATVWRPPSHR